MQTTKFRTEPFTCPSCVKKIEQAVGRQPGVDEVQVGFNSSKVTVTYDESEIAADDIARIIGDLGYPVLAHA